MYHSTLLFLFLAPLTPLAEARPAACAAKGAKATNGKAVYLITNDQANAVVALPIGQDGLLKGAATSTPTGGAGANGIDGSTNQTAAPDALFSQSSLTIAGMNLFAVNAGSNTLSMFTINPLDPTDLTMVGQPIDIPGEFPTTVAASMKSKLACVGSTGAIAGVSCAPFSTQGLGAMDGLRVFNLGQTTPPVGPTNTVSQVFFSDDGSTLFSTVKGDPTKNNTGFLAAFPVEASSSPSAGAAAAVVSQQGTMTSPAGTAVLFGASTIPASNDLFVTDASFGGAVLSLDNKDVATVKGKGIVDGQKATCWVAISPATNTAFVTDVGTNRLVEMSLADATIQSQTDLSANGDPGLIDLRAAGNFIYALSPGNGTTQAAVTVVDALSKKQVQHLQLQGSAVDKNAQGMALLE
ncbi:hypothetical protein Sste5346_010243 [Sporothrix stenoceras]|uniref:3-carboxymuconate cyclase n=1 Tax=Sporothrix stenoceras TaxID=5173 RepID=A0ABR3YGP8_9PEZI